MADTIRPLENVLAEADALIRVRLKEIGLEAPHLVVAVTPDDEIVRRSDVSPDVLRSFGEDLKTSLTSSKRRGRPATRHTELATPASMPQVDLPAGQFAVDLQLVGVLGEPTSAQGRQADRAALRAAVAPAGEALVAQSRRCVVDNGHMPASLTGNL